MVNIDPGSNIFLLFLLYAYDLFLKNLAEKFQILEIHFKRKYSFIPESKVILACSAYTTELY